MGILARFPQKVNLLIFLIQKTIINNEFKKDSIYKILNVSYDCKINIFLLNYINNFYSC